MDRVIRRFIKSQYPDESILKWEIAAAGSVEAWVNRKADRAAMEWLEKRRAQRSPVITPKEERSLETRDAAYFKLERARLWEKWNKVGSELLDMVKWEGKARWV